MDGMPTLLDLRSEMVNGSMVARVVDAIKETNAIVDDLPFEKANSGMTHIYTKVFEYGTGEWRMFNKGVATTKGGVSQGEDHCGMLEAYSEVDKRMAKLSGNPEGYRTRHDARIMKGLGVQMAETAIYGNHATDPAQPTGLTARYNSLALDNVVEAGGDADVTSVWVVEYGPEGVFGFYGEGGMGGIMVDDRGQQTLRDANGDQFEGYRTHFSWEMGLAVADDRAVRRICNIPVPSSVLAPDTDFALFENLLIQQINELPGVGTPVIYCNRDIETQMMIKAKDQGNANYVPGEIGGRGKILYFQGVVPIRRVDAILSTETVVA